MIKITLQWLLRQLSLFFTRTSPEAEVDEARLATFRNQFASEAAIGAALFGPIPAGGQREFFCLNAHTWMWHETFIDAYGKPQQVTTRYVITPDGVLKYQGSNEAQPLGQQEARNFYDAASMYCDRVRLLQEQAYPGALQPNMA